MSVQIEKIRLDGGTQSRAAINEATVSEYAEAMADPNTVFPPIVVYFDGTDYWLADGFHRLAAWSRIGRTDIPADVRQGDRRRAILHSVAANSAHGLRRTNEDKRRAVMTLLEDAEWSQWPQAKIAAACGVSREYVSRVSQSVSCDRSQDAARIVQRNGTTYTQNTANIGGGSKAAQEVSAPAAKENKGEAPAPAVQEAEPVDPEVAKLRRELAKLTPDALMDEVIGLRADLSDEKAKRRALKAENDELKDKLREATADDLGAAVGRLQRRLDQANFARDEALKAVKREEYKRRQAEKRVAELEGMGIAL